ncbi:hypothetical protein HDU76_001045 [Blyttiomyces sp. JEL0837]|nr:hypothetical protein HDU76_001045 [Blyttiomyces sp. JEL0837]
MSTPRQPIDSMALTEASSAADEYEVTPSEIATPHPAAAMEAGSAGTPVAAAAASSSSGNRGSSSAASPLSSGGSKRQFWTRRRKIFCFVCMGVVFVIAAVMIPVLIYVILPNIVQLNINNSKVTLNKASITNPTETGFTVDLDTTFSNAGSFQANLAWDSDIVLMYKTQTIATIAKPGSSVSISGGGGSFVQTGLQAKFISQDQLANFNKFAQDLVNDPNFTWTMSANVIVTVLGAIRISAKVDNKPVDGTGFNGFKGTTISSFDLPGPATDPFTGIKVTLQTTLNNPSQLAVYLGDVEFDIYVPAHQFDNATHTPITTTTPKRIGGIVARDLTVQPGVNTFPMVGALTPIAKDLDSSQIISALFETFLGSQSSQLEVVGKSQGNLGNGPSVSWLNNTVQALNLSIPFAGATPFTLIKTVNPSGPSIDFTSSGSDSTPAVGLDTVTGTFGIPFDFDFSITNIFQSINVTYNGANVGQIKTGNLNATGNWNPKGDKNYVGQFETAIPLQSTKLVVADNEYDAYTQWISDVTLKSGPISATITGVATVTEDTAIGPITLHDLPLPGGVNATALTVTGLGGLMGDPNHLPTINSVAVVAGNAQSITMQVSMSVYNPSNANLNVGNSNFNLVYPANDGTTHQLGNVSVVGLNLPRQATSTLNTTVTFAPQSGADTPAVSEILSKFTGGKNTLINVQGSNNSVPSNRALNTAFSQLKLNSLNLPTNKENLFRGGNLKLTLDSLFTAEAPTTMIVFNPFDTPIYISKINATVRWTDPDTTVTTTIGTINTDLSPVSGNSTAFARFAIQPKTNATSVINTQLRLDAQEGLNSVRAVLSAKRNGNVVIDVTSTILNFIGAADASGFAATIDYQQSTSLTINQ